MLRDLESFEVVALDIPADSEGPPIDAFEQLGQQVAEISGVELPQDGPGAAVSIAIDLSERLDKRTAFAVRGVSSRQKTGPWSDYVIRDILRPAAVPERPEAEAVREGVRVSWTPADRAVRYVLERRVGDELEVAGTTDRSEFVDSSAPWETEIHYRVRSQVGEGMGAVESAPSAEIAITPIDTFPPAPPRLLRAVAAGESVELTWAVSPEEDIAGYIVERDGEALHPDLLQSPSFSDTAPRVDAASEYRVRAVDRKGNRSEPSDPVTVGG